MNRIRITRFLTQVAATTLAASALLITTTTAHPQEPQPRDTTADEVLRGLRGFYAATARDDGSFQPGVDPDYLGMSDCAYSDLAAVTYAVTVHKTFGWRLPHEEATGRFLLSRQRESGDFTNVAGTVDPDSAQGRTSTSRSACSRRF